MINGDTQSDKLRGYDILAALPNKYKTITSIVNFVNDIDKDHLNRIFERTESSIVFWIGEFNYNVMQKLKYKNNVIVYDVIDTLVYRKKEVLSLIKDNIIDRIIVNNNYMKLEIDSIKEFIGTSHVVYHHYDRKYYDIKPYCNDELSFGYMGSIASLRHTKNFLYVSQLSREYPIRLLDTESMNYVDTLDNIPPRNIHECIHKLRDLQMMFNCHVSIRYLNSDTSKYKTTAKIATAAVMDCNIITTNEESVKDLLTEDYPFILYKDDIDSVRDMFNLVIDDYYDKKTLWNKGLEIMKRIKRRLDIDEIVKNYVSIINI